MTERKDEQKRQNYIVCVIVGKKLISLRKRSFCFVKEQNLKDQLI